MQAIEKRIAALESEHAQPYRWVWRNEGESDVQARERAGITPDERAVIIFWKDQDADL